MFPLVFCRCECILLVNWCVRVMSLIRALERKMWLFRFLVPNQGRALVTDIIVYWADHCTTINHITVLKDTNLQKLFLIQKNSFAKFHKFYTNYTRLKEKGFWRRAARGNKEGEISDHQFVHCEHFSNIFVHSKHFFSIFHTFNIHCSF